MKFVTAEWAGEIFVGILNKDETKILPLNKATELKSGHRVFPDTLAECIALENNFIDKVNEIVDWAWRNEDIFIPIEAATLMAPIPRPAKNIFCVGKNYAEHAIEMGSKDDIPEHVMVFTKAPTTVIGNNDSVLSHADITEQLDYEGELAIVIGKKGRGITKEEALDYIFGYTIINDITARDLQARHKQFFIGKSLDTTCPMGPWIVHASAVGNPNHLHIETIVNGEIRQNSNTENFIFPVEEVISVLSAGMTLEPGDIIATGTPAGVGKGFKPPRFLKTGDKVEITIEKIGTLSNRIE
ncbi:fumarylacetoacetate hydrolase family protein [Bacillus sp. S/N-304-OC-R1]|uniref:fumarylacetoacetate hydrolase family protein n=1 Tax=Bacillus sp. S/N-304-OC-R1 TaxID=2758034 RepID=UPI001C8D1EB4|nr:fumarylacetoacetate hydrolase family protein [Bacillus sp. S/N-304-OC-R1]MBY0121069.1 fumarylacetoacetate hydrolase family protein [Bacillus sp. S/N-304-OC-R1]